MNTTRLVWGIVCLALAGLLGVLIFALPPDSLQFTLGDTNVPWLPAVVLGVVGIVLLATATNQQETAAAPEKPKESVPAQDPQKAAMNKRFESVAWGCFLIMLGGFALIPATTIPKGVWSIGVGLIMLGLNGARYLNQIRMSGFTTFLGILSLVGGVAELLGWTSLDGALLLILLGAYLILKPWFDQRQLFGKAEQGRTP